MIQESVAKLVQYGLTTGLIEKEDAIYTANRLLDLLNMDTLEEETEAAIMDTAADESDHRQTGKRFSVISATMHTTKALLRRIPSATGICLTQRSCRFL